MGQTEEPSHLPVYVHSLNSLVWLNCKRFQVQTKEMSACHREGWKSLTLVNAYFFY